MGIISGGFLIKATVDGVGIDKVINKYLATNMSSGVTVNTKGWTDNVQSVSKNNKYLWNYEIDIYTDNSRKTIDPHIIGVYGEEGNGISEIKEYYALSSTAQKPTTQWSPNVPTMTPEMRYLWNMETVYYTNGSSKPTEPRIIGVYGEKGDKGDDGKSVTILGSLKSEAELPSTGKPGDGYLINGILYVWDGKKWNPVGKIQGPAGDSAYIHIAYADFDEKTGAYIQGSFSTTDSGTKKWIGVYVDNKKEHSNRWEDYKPWRKYVGEDGFSPNPNLMDGTALRNSKFWNVFDGDITQGGGKFNTNSIHKKFSSTSNYHELLQQELYGKENRVRASSWYTLTFWAKGTDLLTYMYGSTTGIIDTTAVCYVDGVQLKAQSNGRVEWYLTSEWVRHSFTFKTNSNPQPANCLFRIPSGYEASVSAIKLEEGTIETPWCLSENDKIGEQGQKGAKLRMTDWKVGMRYLSGAEGEEFYDVVRFKRNIEGAPTKLYLCTKTVNEDSELGVNDPATSEANHRGIWVEAKEWKFIATDLMLADKIHASQIHTNELTVEKLETKAEPKQPFIRISGSIMELVGPAGVANIKLGISNNMAVLQFFDNSGKLQYDLGPEGLKRIETARKIPILMTYVSWVTGMPTGDDINDNIYKPSPTTYYKYESGSLVSENDGKIYLTDAMSGQLPTGSLIMDGWYTEDSGPAEQVSFSGTPTILKGGRSINNTYYRRRIFAVSGAKKSGIFNYVYWAVEEIIS